MTAAVSRNCTHTSIVSCLLSKGTAAQTAIEQKELPVLEAFFGNEASLINYEGVGWKRSTWP
jgi:hypothetical protein